MTVPTQIEAAFQELRSHGYDARGEFCCCQGHAIEAFQCDGVEERFVAYHQRDAEMLRETSQAYLTWDGDGKEIVDVLKRHQLAPVWDGDPGSRILITWTRRH